MSCLRWRMLSGYYYGVDPPVRQRRKIPSALRPKTEPTPATDPEQEPTPATEPGPATMSIPEPAPRAIKEFSPTAEYFPEPGENKWLIDLWITNPVHTHVSTLKVSPPLPVPSGCINNPVPSGVLPSLLVLPRLLTPSRLVLSSSLVPSDGSVQFSGSTSYTGSIHLHGSLIFDGAVSFLAHPSLWVPSS